MTLSETLAKAALLNYLESEHEAIDRDNHFDVTGLNDEVLFSVEITVTEEKDIMPDINDRGTVPVTEIKKKIKCFYEGGRAREIEPIVSNTLFNF